MTRCGARIFGLAARYNARDTNGNVLMPGCFIPMNSRRIFGRCGDSCPRQPHRRQLWRKRLRPFVAVRSGWAWSAARKPDQT